MKSAEQIYTTAVAHARDLTGVTLDDYHQSNAEAAVDARMLVVGWMTGYGYTEATLRTLTGWSQQRINYLRNASSGRLNRRIFREMYDELTHLMTTVLGTKN
jgi:hypothetical protein